METWLAFCVEAFYKPSLKNLNDKMYDNIYDMVYRTLQSLQNSELLHENLDLYEEARLLHLLIDSLSLHRVIRPEKLKSRHAEEILMRQLRTLAE